MGALDAAPFPLRPVNEFGMEVVNSAGLDKYVYNRSSYFMEAGITLQNFLMGRLKKALNDLKLNKLGRIEV